MKCTSTSCDPFNCRDISASQFFLISVSSCPTTDICGNVFSSCRIRVCRFRVFFFVLVILYSFSSETELFSFLRVLSVKFLASVIPYCYYYNFLLYCYTVNICTFFSGKKSLISVSLLHSHTFWYSINCCTE